MLTLDLHVHTVHSGDSPCRVEEAIESAEAKKLDGIALTDHNTVAGLESAVEFTENKDFLIIPGIEVSSEDGHILGLGIEESVPRDLSAGETVRRIRENGGISVAAHPFSLSLRPFSPLNANFDAIEVFNSRRMFGNQLAKKYARENDLSVSAGSDAHFCEEIGLAGIKVNCEPQVEEVLKKIREGKASIFGRYLPVPGYLRRALFRCSVYR